MTDQDPIREYLRELAERVAGRGRRSHRALKEIEAHLLDSAESLMRRGIDRDQAMRQAIETFGTPVEVARRFEVEAPFESEVDIMIRILLLPVAVLTLLFGIIFLIAAHLDDAPHWMLMAKIIASTVMILCSAILIYQGWTTRCLANWQRALVLASALMSLSFGSAGAVFTAHLGLVTHDWEMYGFAGAGLLMLQGVLSCIEILLTEPPKATA